jgi:uncharacterized protein YabN with tetrapyrrole methylase and pyrophosphatase domain
MRRTRLWQLPDGKKVLVWADQVDDLRRDVAAYDTVYLIKDENADVYERIAPDSVQAAELRDASNR